MTERERSVPRSSPDSATVRPPTRCRASVAGGIAASTERTSSTSEIPTVNSDAASSISLRRPSSLAAMASPSRPRRRNTSTPRSRIFATNWSCSYCARSTHSTSSNSRSSWFDGVNRCRLSSGRCTITFRRRPTSEWTPNAVMSPPFRTSVWSPGHHLGARVPVDDLLDLRERPDRGAATGRLHEAASRLDLRPHRPGREGLLPQLVDRYPSQRPLLGRSPVGVHRVDVGRHDEQLGRDLAGEQLAGEVLVDDRLHADQGLRRVGQEGRRYPATAGADQHDTVLEQPPDRPDLEDVPRLGRRHHPPPAVAIRLEHPALRRTQRVRLVLRVHRTDELGRVVERRVVHVDLHHGQQRRQRRVGRHRVAQLLLEDVADHAFGLRAEDVEGVRRRLQRQQPDLVTVPVGEDQLVLLGHGGQCGRGRPHVEALVLRGHRLAALKQRVPAQCHDYAHRSLPPAGQSPSVATMTALIVWSRFSAWSKTMEFSDSKTSSVTSRPSMPYSSKIDWPTFVSRLWKAGRQCMNFTFGLPVRVITSLFTW